MATHRVTVQYTYRQRTSFHILHHKICHSHGYWRTHGCAKTLLGELTSKCTICGIQTEAQYHRDFICCETRWSHKEVSWASWVLTTELANSTVKRDNIEWNEYLIRTQGLGGPWVMFWSIRKIRCHLRRRKPALLPWGKEVLYPTWEGSILYHRRPILWKLSALPVVCRLITLCIQWLNPLLTIVRKVPFPLFNDKCAFRMHFWLPHIQTYYTINWK